MKHLLPAAILLSLAAYSGGIDAAPNQAGGAVPGNPMLAQLGEMGGAAEAAVEACGLGDDAAAAKRDQQEQFVRMGGSREQFEAAYQAGYDRARAEYTVASPAERERLCDGFKELGSSTIGSGG